jgi:hypothetical protein
VTLLVICVGARGTDRDLGSNPPDQAIVLIRRDRCDNSPKLTTTVNPSPSIEALLIATLIPLRCTFTSLLFPRIILRIQLIHCLLVNSDGEGAFLSGSDFVRPANASAKSTAVCAESIKRAID